ncbi:winged helix-turn-helix domain-containing protein [Jannaschia formosa]|uniref:winged helix-turn-helix domain-containing protein n=1 Tax=Jannaschia formosa TaxID=2259592 RepID=UPI000E1BC1BB|nr:response regulator transcription factor [Jannaschia formosa]TFL18107.1 response regulator transcription factor [Jannaschia formosa]
MQAPTSSVTETRAASARILLTGIAAIVVVLLATAVFLFATLPDGNAFNARVERIFVETNLTSPAEIGLLEVLAQSGTAFGEVLASYRTVIFVLLVFATALLIACVVLLVAIVTLNRRMGEIERSGIQVTSLVLARAENAVMLNDIELKLTDAAMETLAVLAEARLDGDMLTGAQIESMISGKPEADCDEAAGATRIKRLRDSLGNQIVTHLLIRNITRQGYVLALDPKVIRMI